MRHKAIYISTIIIMLVCNVTLYLHMQDEDITTENTNYFRQKLIEKSFLNTLLYESIDQRISNHYVYLGNNRYTLNINELAKSPKLIFRYSTTMCRPCIDEVISALQEVFPDYIDNKNILFSCKDLEIRLRDSYLNKINLAFSSMDDIPIEKHEIPYFFIIDDDLKIKFVYPILKNNRQEILDYLMIIKKRKLIDY